MSEENNDVHGFIRFLREKAEERLNTPEPSRISANPQRASRRLRHELQVHQVELELQNEELRRIQAELEKSRRRYMDLYHHAPEGYIVLNAAGIIVEANATFAGMVGQGRIQGAVFAEFLVPEDQPVFRARLRTFFRRPADKKIDVRIATGGPRPRHVSLAAALMQKADEGEQAVQDELFVTVTDVSELVMVQEELQRSQQFTLSILDSLTAHVCVLNSRGEIIAVNEAWRRFAAANPPVNANVSEKANYFSVCEVADGEESSYARSFAAGIRAVLEGRQDSFSLEYPCHSPDEERWFVGRVTRLAGFLRGHAVVAHENITERKRMERERLALRDQVSQLAKAESLSNMAGAVAHSFNNSLSVVIGNLEMALDDMLKGRSAVKSVELALRGGWRAAEISGLMLTYLGHGMEQRESLDLCRVCGGIVEDLLESKPKGLVIDTSFPSPGPAVEIHRDQIRQILANLVENAWEAMENKPGRINIAIDTVEASAMNGGRRFPLDWQPGERRYARLVVEDSGCGIAGEDLDRIFDPFFTTRFAGRGMGLAVVLGILRAHDGCVTVASRPGGGTIFQVYLPVEDAEAAAAGDRSSP